MAQQLGRYELLESLGTGATAEVFRAKDTLLGREVALKVLKPALVTDATAFARFAQEAQAAAQLFHPHIALVLDMGSAGDRYFIAMRLVPGRALDKVLAEGGPLPWAEVLRLAEQIGGALAFAHERGFLHRDVKPANIIRTPEGEYVLTDFGLTRAMMATGLTSHTGSVLGTPAYIPPEIWRGKAATPATDEYALACVLVEALTGKVLFAGETPPEVMTRHVLDGAELPVTWTPDAPEGVGAVFAKALSKAPTERHGGPGQLVQALGELLLQQQRAAEEAARKQREAEETARQQRAAEEAARKQYQAEEAARKQREAEAAARKQREAEEEARKQRQDEETARQQPEKGGLRHKLSQLFAPMAVDQPPPTSNQQQATGDQQLETRNSQLTLALAHGVQMGFMRIPAGEFLMGSDPKVDKLAFDDEQPQRKVHLDGYWMGKTPVTVAQFRQFVAATAHKTQAERQGYGWHWNGSEWQKVAGADWAHPTGPASQAEVTHPVVQVSWEDAAAFCAWASQVTQREVRLPTEAEWEKAARGTDGRIYPWGNEKPDARRCNFGMNVKSTTPVGQYSSQGDSPYGCVDMAGNVWEWCADWYDEGYYKTAPSRNPRGPQKGHYRVLRGGSWLDSGRAVRCAYRGRIAPTFMDDGGGFRCVVACLPGE